MARRDAEHTPPFQQEGGVHRESVCKIRVIRRALAFSVSFVSRTAFVSFVKFVVKETQKALRETVWSGMAGQVRHDDGVDWRVFMPDGGGWREGGYHTSAGHEGKREKFYRKKEENREREKRLGRYWV